LESSTLVQITDPFQDKLILPNLAIPGALLIFYLSVKKNLKECIFFYTWTEKEDDCTCFCAPWTAPFSD